MSRSFVAVAGATGELGRLITLELRKLDKPTMALIRPGTVASRTHDLRAAGATLVEVDMNDVAALTEKLRGALCLVSALNGLKDVMDGMQSTLLDAAVAAGVPRFIPSDFSLDFTKTTPGKNRNLDLRRDFHQKLNQSGIAWTSVLNGAFMELLRGDMPVINQASRRVAYLGTNDEVKMDFTLIPDVATFTARVAADPSESLPRYVRVRGDAVSARDLARIMSRLKGQTYTTRWMGPIWMLRLISSVMRFFARDGPVFPAWQGMQYTADLFEGKGHFKAVDNSRHGGFAATAVEEFLARQIESE